MFDPVLGVIVIFIIYIRTLEVVQYYKNDFSSTSKRTEVKCVLSPVLC